MSDPTPADGEQLAELFPFLRGATGLRDEVAACQRVRLDRDQFICMAGDQCQGLPLVVAGSARVYAMSEAGREVTLYRIGAGESCILTAGCLLGGLAFPAFARTEAETEALMVPGASFQSWFERSPAWSAYVSSLIAERLAETITTLTDLLYRPLPARLAGVLVGAVGADGVVVRTHAELAAEIGAAREAVSRCLKRFERDGLVALDRGSLRLLDRDALTRRREAAL